MYLGAVSDREISASILPGLICVNEKVRFASVDGTGPGCQCEKTTAPARTTGCIPTTITMKRNNQSLPIEAVYICKVNDKNAR